MSFRPHACASGLGLALVLLFVAASSVQTAPAPESDDQDLVKQILKELDVPPLTVSRKAAAGQKAEPWPAFSTRVLERYREDRGATRLREATIKARDRLGEQIKGLAFKGELAVPANANQLKTDILEHQRQVARVLSVLTTALEELKTAGEQRDQEPSARWQAHYDFMVARLQLHVAFLYEYQSALGLFRKDVPNLEQPEHNGWRLAAREAMVGDRAGKGLAREAHKLLEKVAADYPNTPWQELAQRTLKAPVGLEWQSAKLN